MVLDSREFATKLVQKYRGLGDDLAQTVFPKGKTVAGEPLLMMLKMHMWNELYLGVLPPSRELELLQEDDALEENLDLFLMISDQIRDEVKHSKLFSRRIEELGGDPNILTFEPTGGQEALLDMMVEHDTVVGPAATLQIASEPMLARIMTTIIENEIVDPRSREVFRQSELDEGNHINTGKRILERFATDEESQRYAERVADDLARTMYEIYRVDFEEPESVLEPAAP